MASWTEILNDIPEGISEADLEDRFVGEFLRRGLGFTTAQVAKNNQFSSSNTDQTVIPDYACYDRDESSSDPVLVVEDKAARPELMSNAIEELQEQMVISKAEFGLATNGLRMELWQRHGNVCVPRSKFELLPETIESAIEEIKNHLQSPRKTLTMMFWVKKGGVGKTTITANIGAALARNGAKVLLVNFDLQGNLNRLMGFPKMTEYNPPVTINDALEDAETGIGEIQLDSLIRTQQFRIRPGLLRSYQTFEIDIIPGDRSMQQVERGRERTDDRSLKLLLDRVYNRYDYVLIDAPPQWEKIAIKAAYASDIAIPIVDNDGFGIDALIDTQTQYMTFGEFEHLDSFPPKIQGCVLNCRLTGQTGENSVKNIRERVQNLGFQWRDWVIKNYADTAYSVNKGMPVVFSKPNSKAAQDFLKLANSMF
ncbi:MAG: AAA family ATPase [Halothece sp.]